MNVTQAAVDGYHAANSGNYANPHYESSPNAMAFSLGAHFSMTGRSIPKDVRTGRGYTLHANNMTFRQTSEAWERIK